MQLFGEGRALLELEVLHLVVVVVDVRHPELHGLVVGHVRLLLRDGDADVHIGCGHTDLLSSPGWRSKSARLAAVPEIRGIAEAKRTLVRESPGSREDRVPQPAAASAGSDGRQADGTILNMSMAASASACMAAVAALARAWKYFGCFSAMSASTARTPALLM